MADDLPDALNNLAQAIRFLATVNRLNLELQYGKEKIQEVLKDASPPPKRSHIRLDDILYEDCQDKPLYRIGSYPETDLSENETLILSLLSQEPEPFSKIRERYASYLSHFNAGEAPGMLPQEEHKQILNKLFSKGYVIIIS